MRDAVQFLDLRLVAAIIAVTLADGANLALGGRLLLSLVYPLDGLLAVLLAALWVTALRRYWQARETARRDMEQRLWRAYGTARGGRR